MTQEEKALLETEVIKKPVCCVCENVVDVWDGDHIIDAYQKGGYNHYNWK